MDTQPAYTEADLEAAIGAYILHGANGGSDVINDRMAAVLDAVAPSLVARAKAEALREAADSWWPDASADSRQWVHARADEIEAGK